jgi:hypothetical protein
MNKMLALCACSAAVVLLLAPFATAGPFTYDWTNGQIFVVSDGNNNEVDFANKGRTTAGVSTGPVTVSTLSLGSGQNAEWTNKSYSFLVTITDGSHSGHVDLSGHFTGHLVGGVATWSNSFDAAPSPLILGSDTFTVGFDSFTGPASFTDKGVLMAHVTMNQTSAPDGQPKPPAPHTNDTPEPATLLLASIGAAAAGLASWRRRKV